MCTICQMLAICFTWRNLKITIGDRYVYSQSSGEETGVERLRTCHVPTVSKSQDSAAFGSPAPRVPGLDHDRTPPQHHHLTHRTAAGIK